MIINLPHSQGIEPYQIIDKQIPTITPKFDRVIFSAAHVTANPFDGSIDWDTTLKYRHYLWELGFGIAEAMDTAQRGMGLTWQNSLLLISESIKQSNNKLIFCGVGTDHIKPSECFNLDDIISAYLYQIEKVQDVGGRLIIMASRALASLAKNADDYHFVYNNILKECQHPVILHWLGEMFDPQLKGYWGEPSMQNCLDIVNQNSKKIDGIKISLLDKDKEIDMRKKLPSQIKMYSGDDFNYPELIEGDGQTYSHALLGIFDAIAPVASVALTYLQKKDFTRWRQFINPTVPLARHIFSSPTRFYKTGIIFLAYLNGHQNHFVMINGHQSSRNLNHFITLFKLANDAGILNLETAPSRMQDFLKVNGG